MENKCRLNSILVHHLVWSHNNSYLCIIIGADKPNSTLSKSAQQKKATFYMITWDVFARKVVSSWKLPMALSSLDYVAGSNELLLISYWGTQGHCVVNVILGTLQELNLMLLQGQGQGLLLRRRRRSRTRHILRSSRPARCLSGGRRTSR